MIIFKKLPSFENTRPKDAVGSWVVELTFLPCFYEGMGWHGFSFGVFQIKSEVLEGERILHAGNIQGFRREYRIWLPWARVKLMVRAYVNAIVVAAHRCGKCGRKITTRDCLGCMTLERIESAKKQPVEVSEPNPVALDE